jgi:formylglycine-generating enzyme required for sulfatase activity
VSWFKAKEYCLNLKKDLPSEAQWEMAAGAEDECSYPWGRESFNNVDGQRQAHAGLSLNEGASEIGQYSPNKYGLYDMAGNVWEWVNDWMDFGWKKNESVHKIIINPTGPISGHKKVRRGGSWSDDVKALSSGWRDWTAPDARYFSDIGFRCVYNP